MADLSIRIAEDGDLPTLALVLGQERFFADRLARQRDGRGLLLVALLGPIPVGDVYLWLEHAEEPEIREWLPGVALLQHLEVDPRHRNRRIGARLVEAAERELRHRGHKRVALGVGLDNHGAMRLYRRLRYEEWPHPPIATTDEQFLADGGRRRVSEMCRIFVKDLVTDGQRAD